MVIADTGFWLALVSRGDAFHARAAACVQSLDEPLITTWPVVTEACFLMLKRLGDASQRAFVRLYAEGGFEVFDLARQHAPRIVELMESYADLPLDLADASLVVLAEQLGHGRILSSDRRHFAALRWAKRKRFENLLAP
jgi:predicted nucleic acid-binding protein